MSGFGGVVMLVAVLGGCGLDRSGLAGRDAGGGVDARAGDGGGAADAGPMAREDAGPMRGADASGADGGADAGVDGGADAGADAGSDAGVDAGRPSCVDRYGAAPGFMSCALPSSSVDGCAFYTCLSGASCNDVCRAGGGECLEAFEELDPGVSCTPECGTERPIDCSRGRNDAICICSRP